MGLPSSVDSARGQPRATPSRQATPRPDSTEETVVLDRLTFYNVQSHVHAGNSNVGYPRQRPTVRQAAQVTLG